MTGLIIPEGRELRPYQVKGAQELVLRERMYLADSPGVGKTVQAIVALATIGFPDTLIVCPKNAIGVWEEHLREWYGIKVKTYQAGKAKYADITSEGILVTNYEQMLDVVERRNYWPVIIFDEAHKLRNRKTNAYRIAKLFSKRFLWLLSGTPVFKGAQDLWAPLALVHPQRFPAYWPFVNTYCNTEKAFWGPGNNVWGIKDPLKLARDITPYFLRRRKEDVLTDLPQKLRVKKPLHMTPKQRQAYMQMFRKSFLETDESILIAPSAAVKTVRLRELLVSPRLHGIDDDGAAIPAMLAEYEENPRPAIVYTPFKEGVRQIARLARAAGWTASELTGGLPASRTTEIVEAFQKGTAQKRMLVCTVQVGTSWTGTAAERVDFIGYDWAPQINVQAEDRMLRYGGSGFECYYWTHIGTIDEHVMDVLSGKVTVENLIMNHRLILDEGRL